MDPFLNTPNIKRYIEASQQRDTDPTPQKATALEAYQQHLTTVQPRQLLFIMELLDEVL